MQPFQSPNLQISEPALESLTQLIPEAQSGKAGAWDRIYALLYDDLHRVARALIRQQQRTSRSPTSLISEAWLRLSSANLTLENRSHLTCLIARAMRFVLIDEARRALTEKHGQGLAIVQLDNVEIASQDLNLEQLLIIDQALNELAEIDPRLAQVVELRFFGGMQEEEIAELLQVAVRTVRRDWRKARAFLFSHLGDGEDAA